MWIWTPAWNLTITPDVGSYTPGQTVNFAIRVADSKGSPVPAAQLTLALAPEDAYFLATPPLPSLGQLRPRADNLVYTYDTLWPYRNFFLYYPTGGCYGLAALTVTMPETPGSWRLVARMMTADFQFTEAFLTLPVEAINKTSEHNPLCSTVMACQDLFGETPARLCSRIFCLVAKAGGVS